jgi:hypothetical protein
VDVVVGVSKDIQLLSPLPVGVMMASMSSAATSFPGVNLSIFGICRTKRNEIMYSLRD